MDEFQPVSADEYQQLMAVLKTNGDKSFVQRILRPNDFPTMPSGDGGIATHRMAWGEADGKYYVYPTVLLNETGKLQDYGDKAWNHVRSTGNYIEFPTAEKADWFSRRYKGAWGGQMNKPPQ